MRILTIIITLSLSLNIFAQSDIWLTDYNKAVSEATENNQYILLSFSGSDWCGNCIKLDKSLFSTEQFQDFASKHLVLLKADFPAKKANQLSKEQTAHNEALAEKYNKSGAFPTTLILNEKGDVVAQLPTQCSDVAVYLATIETAISK